MQAGCELRPWLFPNFEELRPVYQLRNSMLPYLYSASAAATTSGVLPMHPLYYDWPGEEQAYTVLGVDTILIYQSRGMYITLPF